MMYTNLNNNEIVSFEEAMIKNISFNKELYIPKTIPKVNSDILKNIDKYNNIELGYHIIKNYISNYIKNKNTLYSILENTIHFDFPLKQIENNTYTLELFHGPTMSFKDLGVKFMAEILEYYVKQTNKIMHVIVATSGDTGGAVARGFYKKNNIKVIILYPKNRISKIQEQQITSLGENIQAVEIIGNFDDCQKIVKKTFIDKEILNNINITSANSINIARLLPQTFYYFFIYKQLKQLNLLQNNQKIVISVPSGNFGNICSGIISKLMGLPIYHFIASTNINDTIPRFMKSGKYNPKKTISTISNAMDISNPSNFPRILYLFNNDIDVLKSNLSSYSFNDQETIQAIKNVYYKCGYIMDPHGAIGYLGLNKNKNQHRINIFLGTAHPIKFIDALPRKIQKQVIYTEQKLNDLNKKNYIQISNKYDEFKHWLLSK